MIKFILGLFIGLLLGDCPCHAAAKYIERDDGGGIIKYQSQVEGERMSGERIVIDGLCASACTLRLQLPRSQICATPRGVFMFHTATSKLLGLPDPVANERLMNSYPSNVRALINLKGGLWLTPIYIKATNLVPSCRK